MRTNPAIGIFTLIAIVCLTGACSPEQEAAQTDTMQQTATPDDLQDVLLMPAMNVFRRHTVQSADMFHFYSKVLGFEQLGTYDVAEGGVTRFQIGPSELKLTLRVEDREYVEGGVSDATGLRLLTFYFPDQATLETSFREHGLPAPEFEALPDSDILSAVVFDPDGQAVQLLIAPNRPAEFYEQLEVGLTVSNLEASGHFYADFVGLEPMPSEYDPVFDTEKLSFRNGSTIISLRSFGYDLPADTGSGGIQYVVSDAQLVNDLASERNVVVDQPLSTLEGFDMLFIWLDDPDGITNYFAQTGQATQ